MEDESASDPHVFRFNPHGLDNMEDLEQYEPGGFHPVHLDDYYDDNRYRVVNKLGAGGFSTVWLARDLLGQQWVGLKFIVATESENYNNRSSAIIAHPTLARSDLLVSPEREFWVDGPNGRHLCFVLPFVGPNLATSRRYISTALLYTTATCRVWSEVLINSVDFTADNIALALSERVVAHNFEDIYRDFGYPISGPPGLADPEDPGPGPHAPQHIVIPLDFFASSENLLTEKIRILDFDQSFRCHSPPKRTGTPAKHMAPEVIAGGPPSKASDIWSLGCAIFRLRAGRDIFFDYDTFSPADALQQIHRFLGDLPDSLVQALFDDEGYPTEHDTGTPLMYFKQKLDLEAEIKKIWDEPPSLSMRSNGEIDTTVYTHPGKPDNSLFLGDFDKTIPYPQAYRSMVWKPTAVSVDGDHYIFYEDESSPFWAAFPPITDDEAKLLGDLLSRIFVYDPSRRPNIEEVLKHPWFEQYGALSEKLRDFAVETVSF